MCYPDMVKLAIAMDTGEMLRFDAEAYLTSHAARELPEPAVSEEDARAMAELTDSCFRFVPFAIDARQLESIHGTDECVDVSTLVPAVKFYRYMMSEGGT